MDLYQNQTQLHPTGIQPISTPPPNSQALLRPDLTTGLSGDHTSATLALALDQADGDPAPDLEWGKDEGAVTCCSHELFPLSHDL